MRRRRWRFSLQQVLIALGVTAVGFAAIRAAFEDAGMSILAAHFAVDGFAVALAVPAAGQLQVGHRLPAWRVWLLCFANLGVAALIGGMCGVVGDLFYAITTASGDDFHYGYFAPASACLSVLASSAYFAIYRRNVCREG